MKDSEIADGLVDRGLAYRFKADASAYSVHANAEIDESLSASQLIAQWEIAGRCLEDPEFYYAVEQDEHGSYINAKRRGRRKDDNNLAADICQSYVTAITEGS